MKWELVKRRGETLIRITVGGKSKAIKRAERRMQKRALEIRSHFYLETKEVKHPK